MANSEAIAVKIPKAELRVYDGGHLFLLQDRSAWSEIVEYLRGPG